MRRWTEDSYAGRIGRVLDVIVARMDEPLRLEDLAAIACVSPFHFHRMFQAMVGETVAEVVRRLRLARAGWRSRATDATVMEIALEAGYGSVEGFGRAFRQAYSMAPSRYRRAHVPPAYRPSNIRIAYAPERGAIRFIQLPGDHGMDVTIERFPAEPAILLRHVGPYDRVVGAYRRMDRLFDDAGLRHAGTKVMGLSYDDPDTVPLQSLRYDVCFTTPKLVPDLPEGFRSEMLPGGRYAVTVHEGSYSGFADAFQRLFGLWLPESGDRLGARGCIEWYLNDPMNTPEADLRTKLCIPLAD